MQENDVRDEVKIPGRVNILPVRDIVVYPYMTLPLHVGRDTSIRAVDESLARDRLIMIGTQKDAEIENPSPDDIYTMGTISMIVRMLKQQDGRVKLLVQGLTKARIREYLRTHPMFLVRIEPVIDLEIKEVTLEIEALIRNVKEKIERILSLRNLPQEILTITDNINDPGILADLVCSNLRLKIEEAQSVLEMLDPFHRLKEVDSILSRELEVSTMQAKIQDQAREEMGKMQREYFLREQLRAIKSELGDIDEKAEEIEDIRQKIQEAKMPEEVEEEANKQVRRLDAMHAESTEASIIRTYLDWLVLLPWSRPTPDNLDILQARKVLDEDHYDLDMVKERILEYLSVRKLKDQMKGPILCFVGPPGVGKTSLGRSIARAMGRKFIRISLGGVRDEAEIRGHRRTYVGALPGRIIQGIKQAGSNNPVFMMDEVDKIGMDFRGDPSAALLEVLDPEQNYAFSDHYLNLPFDLSNVMFITTANLTDPIPSALKDRMEIMTLPGYTDAEKLKIARRFLIPRQIEENGITETDLGLSDRAIYTIINQYTKESGLRNLEREVAKVCRKIARRIAEGDSHSMQVTSGNLHRYLGVPRFLPEEEIGGDRVGVATGLAWTQAGGEILAVEASIVKGRGKLTLTGHLGDVMKESAQAALTYARSIACEYGIDEDFIGTSDIHIHVPAGAIPKDGPSAGVTMATALMSALTRRPVRHDLSMTGEITLRGRILGVGGVKEKVLAALRSKMDTVVLPAQNRKDVVNIPKSIRRKIRFHFADDMKDILPLALEASEEAGEA